MDGSLTPEQLAALDSHGWETVAELSAPPKLCERCQARVVFGAKRCSKCEAAWSEWLRASRKKIFPDRK